MPYFPIQPQPVVTQPLPPIDQQNYLLNYLRYLQSLVPNVPQVANTYLPPVAASLPLNQTAPFFQQAGDYIGNRFGTTLQNAMRFNPSAPQAQPATPSAMPQVNAPNNALAFVPYGQAGGNQGKASGTLPRANVASNPETNATPAAPSDPWALYKNMAAKAGVDWNVLQKVYMPQYKQTYSGIIDAISHAREDGTWAQLFHQTVGRPPNEVEWKEHAQWRQSGGNSRDPILEPGHNVAIKEWERLLKEESARNQTPATPLPAPETTAPPPPVPTSELPYLPA